MQSHESFVLCFLLRVFTVLHLKFRSFTHFELIFVVLGMSPPSCFCTWMSNFLCHLLKRLLLIEWSWRSCQKLFNHMCEGLFIGFSSFPLICMPFANTLLFDQCSFIVSFEMRKYESSTFVLFQDCFGYLSPLKLHMDLGCVFLFLEKSYCDSDKDCIEY